MKPPVTLYNPRTGRKEMPTEYDPEILHEYADALYKQARYIVIREAIKYVLIVFLLSGVVLAGISVMNHMDFPNQGQEIVIVFLTFLAVVAGVDAGRRKAFSLKLGAQQLLCQRQIEQNTRAR
jgi:hypothetical protein